jgi:methionine biosynthesis protein MetW
MSYLERVFRATEEENRQAILRALEPRPGGVLLDLGCSDGEVTNRIAARAGVDRVVGVELIDHLAAEARGRGIEVVAADLNARLPFDDASFDVIHSNQVIEHLWNTDNLLREIRRLLKPDGYAVVSTNNLASWHNVVSLAMGWQPPPCHASDELIVGNPAGLREGVTGARGQMHLRLFTGRALEGVARHHGLDADVAQTVGMYPLPVRLARLMTRVDKRHGAFLVQRYRPVAAAA